MKVRATKEGRNQGKRMASLNVEDQTGSVRAVAFSDGRQKVVVVSLDLIGFFHDEVVNARRLLDRIG